MSIPNVVYQKLTEAIQIPVNAWTKAPMPVQLATAVGAVATVALLGYGIVRCRSAQKKVVSFGPVPEIASNMPARSDLLQKIADGTYHRHGPEAWAMGLLLRDLPDLEVEGLLKETLHRPDSLLLLLDMLPDEKRAPLVQAMPKYTDVIARQILDAMPRRTRSEAAKAVSGELRALHRKLTFFAPQLVARLVTSISSSGALSGPAFLWGLATLPVAVYKLSEGWILDTRVRLAVSVMFAGATWSVGWLYKNAAVGPGLEGFGPIAVNRELVSQALDEREPLPFIGQEHLMQDLEEACRAQLDGDGEKKIPVLVGASGCGKTAAVKELAHRIAWGKCKALEGVRIFEVTGDEISRWGDADVDALIRDAGQNRSGCLLFIDNCHDMAGAHEQGVIARLKQNMLGPLAVIAATTPDQYSKFAGDDGKPASNPFRSHLRKLEFGTLPPDVLARILRERAQCSWSWAKISDEALGQFVAHCAQRFALDGQPQGRPGVEITLMREALEQVRASRVARSRVRQVGNQHDVNSDLLNSVMMGDQQFNVAERLVRLQAQVAEERAPQEENRQANQKKLEHLLQSKRVCTQKFAEALKERNYLMAQIYRRCLNELIRTIDEQGVRIVFDKRSNTLIEIAQ